MACVVCGTAFCYSCGGKIAGGDQGTHTCEVDVCEPSSNYARALTRFLSCLLFAKEALACVLRKQSASEGEGDGCLCAHSVGFC